MATKRGTNNADILLGGATNDTLLGLAGNDVLIGGSGNDRLDGGASNDRLVGGAGNDVLIGGPGTDNLRGDAGNDFYMLDGAGEIARSIADAGTDTVEASVSYALGVHQENLRLAGMAALAATGNAGANLITGNGGNNRLDGGAGNDVLIGGAGNDTLIGGAGTDRLRGDAGNDFYVIDDATEIDKSIADDGIDTVQVTQDYVLGPRQENLLMADIAPILNGIGNRFNNVIVGNRFNNVLNGSAGDDVLIGGRGSDFLIGGPGADRLRGDEGGDGYDIDGVDEIDKLLADPGADTVFSSVSYTLGPYQEHLTLTGSAPVSATGNAGDNVIIGNFGNNILDGGAGRDELHGGAGNDTLVAGSPDEVLDGGTGVDTLLVTGVNGSVADLLPALRSIEVFDIRGSGANVLDMRDFDFSGLSRELLSESGTLRIRLDADDTFTFVRDHLLGLPWLGVADAVIDGVTYDHYINGGADLFVESVTGVLPLTSIREADGFRVLDHHFPGPHWLASAGDVNGDGIDDLMTSEPTSVGGSVYVAFGTAGTVQELAVEFWPEGFRVEGAAQLDLFGARVGAGGDFNGDGFGDVLISATGLAQPRMATLLFGAAGGFPDRELVEDLTGDQAIAFSIANQAPGDVLRVAAAGDINGDGFDDLVFGQPEVSANDIRTGAVHVVFGAAGGVPASVDLAGLNGANGFHITDGAYQHLGYSISRAGDVNGDGIDDLVIGENSDDSSSSAYVIFGTRAGFAATLNRADIFGSHGFTVSGGLDGHDFGDSIGAAGDFNGDGFDDLVLSESVSGNAFVLFGFAADEVSGMLGFGTFDGTHGMAITGGGIRTVSGAGDVNGDGYDDVLVSNDHASRLANEAGSSYLVYGDASGLPVSLDPASADAHRVLRFDGAGSTTHSGHHVESAGDINGDGLADLLIGVDPSIIGYAHSLAGYVIYGDTRAEDLAQRGDSGNNVLTGSAAAESLIGGFGDDVLDGAGGADVLYGGAGNDVLIYDAADRRVAGGGGEDTLRVDGSGVTLDLTALADNRLDGIERFDLTGSGDNSLTLNINDVLALPNHADQFLALHTRQLLIDGNVGDAVHASGQAWVQAANVEIGGKTYASYTHAAIAAELLIDIDVTRDIS